MFLPLRPLYLCSIVSLISLLLRTFSPGVFNVGLCRANILSSWMQGTFFFSPSLSLISMIIWPKIKFYIQSTFPQHFKTIIYCLTAPSVAVGYLFIVIPLEVICSFPLKTYNFSLDYCQLLLLCLEIGVPYFFWPFISPFFKHFFKQLFIYLFLAVLGLCCYAGFSLFVAIRGNSLVAVHDFSLRWLLLLWSPGSRAQAK